MSSTTSATTKYSFPKEKMRILLLEGIHPAAVETFAESGYRAEILPRAFDEDELVRAMPGVHVLGIRSKSRVTQRVLDAASHLLAVGCYCIGTNQVEISGAARRGVPVFNAPFSNTRSVAELAIAEVVMLARRAAHRSMKLHAGAWDKSATGSFEVRQKTIGIVGYGHIGPQVGLLAEALGMRVVFHDVVRKLPLGNARPADSLDELLAEADFVTLHVPETPTTRGMIGQDQLSRMRKGGYLLNLSRGSVVDLDALRDALVSGHLAGAAVDVFPQEPASNAEPFESPLQGLDNVILTPHVGGSTAEAQQSIGLEVTGSLVRLIETGSTTGAVNFPGVELPLVQGGHRVINVHRNEPGVLSDINRIVAETGANVESQYLGTRDGVGYLIMDVDHGLSREVKRRIETLDANIKTRLLF